MAMQLTDSKNKNLKPQRISDSTIEKAQPKVEKYTIAIGSGLSVIVMPDGAKYWRLRYTFAGKQKMLAVGKPFPITSLKEAQAKASEYRLQVIRGIDPSEQVRLERLTKQGQIASTFGLAAEGWYAHRCKAWNPRTAKQARAYLDCDILPKLRSRPLDNVTPVELVSLITGIEARGAFNIAKKTRQWLKAIYSYARAMGWTSADPAKDLTAITSQTPQSENYAHLKLDELPGFLKALNAYDGSTLVKQCAWLALWTGNRPGVTRTLRWSEVDLEKGLWTIEKKRGLMKRGYHHVTPLPVQAVAMLRELQNISGRFEYVFIGRNDPKKPLSDGAIAGMIQKLGFRTKQTAHGFRHVISTALNEMGYDPDWVERQLAHGDPNKIRGTYNKAHYVDQRTKMMQDWANHLDGLLQSAH